MGPYLGGGERYRPHWHWRRAGPQSGVCEFSQRYPPGYRPGADGPQRGVPRPGPPVRELWARWAFLAAIATVWALALWVMVLFVLAFLLAGSSFWLSVRTVQGQIRSRASVVQLCQAGNESRAQQVTLWTHLIAISQPPPHQTAAQKRQRQATIRKFLAYVR